MPCVEQSKQIKTWDYDRMYTACSSLKRSFMWKKIISFNIEKLQEIQQAKQVFAGNVNVANVFFSYTAGNYLKLQLFI